MSIVIASSLKTVLNMLIFKPIRSSLDMLYLMLKVSQLTVLIMLSKEFDSYKNESDLSEIVFVL